MVHLRSLLFFFMVTASTASESFTIGTWGGPASEILNGGEWKGWKTLSEAHFNVIGPITWHPTHAHGYDWPTILNDVGRYDLKIIVVDADIQFRKVSGRKAWRKKAKAIVEEFSGYPSLLGYFLFDEPGIPEFSNLKIAAKEFYSLDAKHPTFINLFPTYASTEQLGTSQYSEYVNRFLKIVRPPMLSYDHYAIFEDGVNKTQYFTNMYLVRDHAHRVGIPAWNTMQMKGWKQFKVPDKIELSWQVFTSLAYGMKGIFYWHIMEKGGKGGGIIDSLGNPVEPQYSVVKDLNLKSKIFGALLKSAQHIGAYHGGVQQINGTKPIPENLPLTFDKSASLLVGHFQTVEDAYFLLVNDDLNASLHARVGVTENVKCLKEIDLTTGQSFQLSKGEGDVLIQLQSGEGRLLVVCNP